MANTKKYYWYKMKKDFFENKIIKYLSVFEDGDSMIILFEKLMLYSLEKDGYIYFDNMLPSIEAELAMMLGANIELVTKVLEILIKFSVVKKIDDNTYYIVFLEDCIGAESDSATRVRKHRDNEKCNAETLHCNGDVLHCNGDALHCNTEIEKDIDKEKELYKEKKPFSFSDEKKGERFYKKNNFYKNDVNKGKSSSYDIDEFMKKVESTELVYKPKNKKAEND